MNFFGIMRKYLVPFSLICAMFPTFPTMSGAQGVFFPISYTQPTVFPGTKPLGRFGDQFANPTGTAVVDLNGDGFKDVVLALSVGLLNEASPPITPRFLISDGKGGLVDRTEELIVPPLPQMFLPRDIHVADFNGDGRPDLFFSNHGKETGGPLPCQPPHPGEQNRLLLSQPDGRYRDATADSLPALVDFSHGSSVADIDGDGDIDIWVNDLGCPARSYLLQNDGSGRFTIVADLSDGSVPGFVGRNGRLPSSFNGASWTQFLDADGDGDPDLYHVSAFDCNVGLLINDGSGRFTKAPPGAIPAPLFCAVQDSLVLDLNKDGLDDLVLYQDDHLSNRSSGFGNLVNLQILISNGDGTFRDETRSRLPAQISQGITAPEVSAGDVDGDHLEDLLVSLFWPDFSHVITDFYIDRGGGMFAEAPEGVFPIRPQFAAVDLNGDGFDDFIFSSFRSSASLEVFGTLALPPPRTLFAATLPSSRSVRVGQPATVFATIINAGSQTAVNFGIVKATGVSGAFDFQTTNSQTNALEGQPNVPVDIPPGGSKSFVVAFTPSRSLLTKDVRLRFGCENSLAAESVVGLNTVLLSVSNTAVPDIVALAATPTNDGIVNVPGTNGTGAFAVATVNVGAGGSITASADTGSASLPINISLCQTDPATGQCISSISSSATTTINANSTPTFGIFVQGSGNVPFDPATNRIFVRFKDGGGVTRGSTSVAVRTQ
jgi:FG-GAP-like repeat